MEETMNSYKSFFLEDLKNKIRAAALETMLIPMIADDDPKTVYNASVAVFNDGVLTMADALISVLEKEASESEDGAMD